MSDDKAVPPARLGTTAREALVAAGGLGLAVGVAFGAAALGIPGASVAGALALALGIGLGVIWWFARKEKGGASVGSREFWTGLAFLSPWIVGFLVFTAGPIVFSIIIIYIVDVFKLYNLLLLLLNIFYHLPMLMLLCQLKMFKYLMVILGLLYLEQLMHMFILIHLDTSIEMILKAAVSLLQWAVQQQYSICPVLPYRQLYPGKIMI